MVVSEVQSDSAQQALVRWGWGHTLGPQLDLRGSGMQPFNCKLTIGCLPVLPEMIMVLLADPREHKQLVEAHASLAATISVTRN